MTRHLAIVLVLLAACFGGGPAPSVPEGATVVFQAPAPPPEQACSDSRYIASVAIADDEGYVVTLPYQPVQQNCGGQGPAQVPLELDSFAKDGSTPAGQPAGNAPLGTWSPGTMPPGVAVSGTELVYSYADGGQGVIGPAMAHVGSPPNASGNGPSALWIDPGGALYGAWGQLPMGGIVDPGDPQYPGDGMSSAGAGVLGSVPLPLAMNQNIPAAAIDSSTLLECSESRHCAVTTDTGVFFVTAPGAGSTSFAQLHALAKATGTDTPLDFPGGARDGNLTLVGLDSDGTRVIAAFAYAAAGASTLRPGCWIYASQGDAPTLVFQTTAFSCMDATIDGDSVYFAIVHGEGCDCGPPFLIHGDGIARVSLSDPSKLESIAVKIGGLARGPRRVYRDADAIYAVDPLAVARIAKTALDGAHDFTP